MFREISTKSGIFSKRRKILHFFAKCVVPSASGGAGAIWRLDSRACGARLARFVALV